MALGERLGEVIVMTIEPIVEVSTNYFLFGLSTLAYISIISFTITGTLAFIKYIRSK